VRRSALFKRSAKSASAATFSLSNKEKGANNAAHCGSVQQHNTLFLPLHRSPSVSGSCEKYVLRKVTVLHGKSEKEKRITSKPASDRYRRDKILTTKDKILTTKDKILTMKDKKECHFVFRVL
jgi:hypothetical protein